MNDEPLTCDLCRKPFAPEKYMRAKRYCSRACQTLAYNNRRRIAYQRGDL